MDFKSASTTAPPQTTGRTRGGGGGEGSEGGVRGETLAADATSTGGTSSRVPATAEHGPAAHSAPTRTRSSLKGMNPLEDGRRASKDDTPPPTPPPRPPPPRQPPSLQEMREKERILQRMTSMPAYSRSDSLTGGPRASRAADRHLSMNGGKNLSLDQPYYSPQPRSFSSSSSSAEGNITSSKDFGPDGQLKKETEDVISKGMEGIKVRNTGQNSAKVRPGSAHEAPGKSDAAAATIRVQSDQPKDRSDKNHPQHQQADEAKSDSREMTRAPKFTTTKRRSSTVDEMLFDDYVEPEVDQPDSAPFSPENLPQDLMSFDQEALERVSPGKVAGESRKGGGGEDAAVDDLNSPTSVDSSDAEYGETVPRSASQMSNKSWSSNYSLDSQPDDLTVECMEFMKAFVDKVFNNDEETTQVEKAKFGELCQHAPGRLWFSRYVNSQRVNNKRVAEETFFRLVQYLAVCLFECNEAEDFSPAKTLMNMCFTFYCDMPSPAGDDKSFLYMFLKEQPIWQSLRFWNAAFFDAVQCERSRRPMATNSAANDTMTDDRNFQENITFGQLGTFCCNMRAFGLSRELCLEFLRKQSTIANLSTEQVKLLRDNVNKMKE